MPIATRPATEPAATQLRGAALTAHQKKRAKETSVEQRLAAKEAKRATQPRPWLFEAIPGKTDTGAAMNVKLRTKAAQDANGGNRFIKFKLWVYGTTERAIRDELRARIKDGSLRGVREQVFLRMRCTVKGCEFATEKSGPAAYQELQAHFMDVHAGVVGGEDPADDAAAGEEA